MRLSVQGFLTSKISFPTLIFLYDRRLSRLYVNIPSPKSHLYILQLPWIPFAKRHDQKGFEIIYTKLKVSFEDHEIVCTGIQSFIWLWYSSM